MIKTIVCCLSAVVIITASAFSVKLIPGNRDSALAGDTMSFTPNGSGGWSILSSYLNNTGSDSTEFELILQHAAIEDFSREQLIGSITGSAYLPAEEQHLDYYLLHDNLWRVRITLDGKTYLNQISGTPLTGDPLVIPVKVRFKK